MTARPPLRAIVGGKRDDGPTAVQVMSLEVIDDLIAKRKAALALVEARESREGGGLSWRAEIEFLREDLRKLLLLKAEMV